MKIALMYLILLLSLIYIPYWIGLLVDKFYPDDFFWQEKTKSSMWILGTGLLLVTFLCLMVLKLMYTAILIL